MAEVFTTVPGAVLEIGHYGQASNDTPARVPDEVAAELADRTDLHVVPADVEVPVSVVVMPPGEYAAGQVEDFVRGLAERTSLDKGVE